MIHDLAYQKCFNHARREAAVLCPECRRYYCRECVTEHEDRVVCAPCLARLTGAREERGARLGFVVRLAQCAVGLLAVWLFFYLLGQGLLALPSSFHEGDVWQVGPWEIEE